MDDRKKTKSKKNEENQYRKRIENEKGKKMFMEAFQNCFTRNSESSLGLTVGEIYSVTFHAVFLEHLRQDIANTGPQMPADVPGRVHEH